MDSRSNQIWVKADANNLVGSLSALLDQCKRYDGLVEFRRSIDFGVSYTAFIASIMLTFGVGFFFRAWLYG